MELSILPCFNLRDLRKNAELGMFEEIMHHVKLSILLHCGFSGVFYKKTTNDFGNP